MRETVGIGRRIGIGQASSQGACCSIASSFAGVKWTSTCCKSVRRGDKACGGVGCVAVSVRVASWGQCWPSRGKLARRGKGGHTPIGACPPRAVAGAEVRTDSSAATSFATGSPSVIATPSVALPLPILRILAPPLFFDIYSRPKSGHYSCTTTTKRRKRSYYTTGRGRAERTPSSPFTVCRNIHSSIACKEKCKSFVPGTTLC